jgi:fluoroacetyl-CoA thioesterase
MPEADDACAAERPDSSPSRPPRAGPSAAASGQSATGARGYDPAVPLEPGLRRTDGFVVEERMTTDVRGSLGVRVLSTPAMIAMMERSAAMLAEEHLVDGNATVGFSVCIKHVAGALEGASCSASADLREITDGRKLHFDVRVCEGERTIGLGTHERRVIDADRHAQRARGA